MSNVSDLDLRIAKLLRMGWSYRNVKSVLRVGNNRINKVKRLMEEGAIRFDGPGNPVTVKPATKEAFMAQPARKEIEEIHEEVMKQITEKASEVALQNAEEDYALGNEIRQYWTLKAQEAGLPLRGYVRSALIFYDTYRDKVEEMQEQLTMMEVLKETLKTDLLRTHKMDLFYKFARYCLYLRTQGFQLPESLLNDFYNDLSTLETFLKRGRKSPGELAGGMGNVGEGNEVD